MDEKHYLSISIDSIGEAESAKIVEAVREAHGSYRGVTIHYSSPIEETEDTDV